MQQLIVFDGMDVLNQDMRFLEDSKSNESRRRTVDTAASFGVVSDAADSKMRPTQSNAFEVSLTAGSAYDGKGDFINIPNSQPLPTIAVAAPNVNDFIWIEYLSVDTDSRAHPVTGVLNATRRKDSSTYRNPDNTYTLPPDEVGPVYTAGFTITLDASAPSAFAIKLGKITAVDGLGNITMSLIPGRSFDAMAERYIYSAFVAAIYNGFISADPIDDFIQHINTFGSLGMAAVNNPHGLVPADIGAASASTTVDLETHEREMHSTGLIGDSQGTTGLEIIINSAAAPDDLTVTDLLAGDLLIVAGKNITALAGPVTLSFAAVVPQSLWQIYVKPDGTLDKFKISENTATPSAFKGVQVVEVHLRDISVTPSFRLDPDVSPRTLAWSSGTPAIQLTGSGFFKIPGPTPDLWVVVYVDATQLATITPGLKIEAIILTPGIGEETGYVIGNVPWSGSASGFLGYGNGISSGSALDQRTYGNLKSRNVNTSYKEELASVLANTRSDGVVGATDFPLSFTALTFNFSVGAGSVYINGKHVISDGLTGVVPNATATVFFWIASDGTVNFGTTLPPVRPQFGTGASAGGADTDGFAVIGQAVTSAGVGIQTFVQTGRLLLADLDGRLASVTPGASGSRMIGNEVAGLGVSVYNALFNLNANKGGIGTTNTWLAPNTFTDLVEFKHSATNHIPFWRIDATAGSVKNIWEAVFASGTSLLMSMASGGTVSFWAHNSRVINVGGDWENPGQLVTSRLRLAPSVLTLQRPDAGTNPLPEGDWEDLMGIGRNVHSDEPLVVTPEKTMRAKGKFVTDGAGGFTTNVALNCTIAIVGSKIHVTIDAGLLVGTFANWIMNISWGLVSVFAQQIDLVAGVRFEITPYDETATPVAPATNIMVGHFTVYGDGE